MSLRASVVVPALAGLLTFSTQIAAAQAQSFFGEDLSGFPQNNNRLDPTEWVNSTSAFNLFRSTLTADIGIESFEDFSGTWPDSPTGGLTLDFPGAGTATLTGGGAVQTISDPIASENGVYASEGSNFYRVETSGAGFQIDFSAPTAGFGFFGTDIGDFGGQLVLQFKDALDNVSEVEVDHTRSSDGFNSGSMLFYGRIDTGNPFTSVTFTDRGTAEGFGFDQMIIAAPNQVIVPEPGTILLLMSGLLGLGVVAVRRNRQVT